jgi:hypothetical protein
MMVAMQIRTFLLALVVALLVVAVPSALAADGASGTRMILKLADGSSLRATARETADGFEVKTGESWRLVRSEDLVSARAESEVLAERRDRLDGIPLTHVGERVEACAWMIDQGLDAEAITELDRILRLVPDERHVLLLLAARPPHLDLGVKATAGGTLCDALLREGARTCNIGASPVRRELVVQALRASAPAAAQSEPLDSKQSDGQAVEAARSGATRVDTGQYGTTAAGQSDSKQSGAPVTTRESAADPLLAALLAELDSNVYVRRTFACLALRRLFPTGAIGQLTVHAVLDPSVDVRDEAILGLRAAQDPKACGMLVQALANPSSLVRTNAIDAIGRAGYAQGVEPLIQLMITANAAAAAAGGSGGGPVRANLYVGLQTTYVQDFNVQIAQGASIADPIVGVLQSGIVFDVGVGGVSSIPITTELWTAARSLVRLTGARIGADPPAWEKWWKENRWRYVPGASHKSDTRD